MLDSLIEPAGVIAEAEAEAQAQAQAQAQALILTNCTYDGLRYDLLPIIAATHAKGIKVIIDEA